MLVNAGKYRTEDKLKTQTKHNPQKYKIQHSKTTLVQLPFMTLNQ